MKILVPLSKAEYLESYIRAGADELYLGFHDDEWTDTYDRYADINRMSGFGSEANPYSFQEALRLIQEIKACGKDAFVTMNANAYSASQIQYMEENYFPALRKAGADGVIVSDIYVIQAAVRAGLRPVASTMCAIYNTDIARAYERLGVKRMILPRDVSLAEIRGVCESMPDVQFEAFFMRNGCIFSDGYCLGMHRPECGATCTYIRNGEHRCQHDYSSFADIHDIDLNEYLYRTSFHREACAMCALYRLREMGVTSIKIVGRADDHEGICRDVALTRQNIKIAEQAGSEEEYLRQMRLPENAPAKCRMGLGCYYPEVRFGETV